MPDLVTDNASSDPENQQGRPVPYGTGPLNDCMLELSFKRGYDTV